jgi:hypothetical protein
MRNSQKINDLLSTNYNSNVSLLGDHLRSKYASIVDTNNGTAFIVSTDLFFFKDQNGNLWMTLIKSLVINAKQYQPKIGELYSLTSGVKYNFTTKEEVVDLAISYFSKHLNR